MTWRTKAGLIITAAVLLGLLMIYLTGCATTTPYDCGDNHRPVAKIEVRQ